MNHRQHSIADSNNPKNPNKNLCVLAVAKHLKVDSRQVKFLHYISDLVNAARVKYTVGFRTARMPKFATVGSARSFLAAMSSKEKKNVLGYIIYVKGHVIFLNKDGKTVVDTDPRKRDVRTIWTVHIVLSK